MQLPSSEGRAPAFSSHPGEFRRKLVERSGLAGKTMVSRHRTEDFLRKDGAGHRKPTKRVLRQLWAKEGRRYFLSPNELLSIKSTTMRFAGRIASFRLAG